MIITIVRTLIMYILVVGALRMMGQRQIGELEASRACCDDNNIRYCRDADNEYRGAAYHEHFGNFDAYDFRGNPVVFGVQEYGRENCALRAAEYVL